ncbi:oxytocin-neurophysin 1-like [Tupaia chinensis]|uniref:oxytocin-neurophysin 1-like n=1 Tax=Tupaia chinensis TaxID=246437 RepID=UPI000703EBFA|nr:oxytocin-neurophysin 1-like [Tupaia chinensis]
MPISSLTCCLLALLLLTSACYSQNKQPVGKRGLKPWKMGHVVQCFQCGTLSFVRYMKVDICCVQGICKFCQENLKDCKRRIHCQLLISALREPRLLHIPGLLPKLLA